MKKEGLSHPKTHHLACLLEIELPHAVGLLEFLFTFTGSYAPQGDVGKHTDGVIASNCHWRGNASELVEALVQAGFVDRCCLNRLVIHDWEDHMQQWVANKLKSKGLKPLKAVVDNTLKRDEAGPGVGPLVGPPAGPGVTFPFLSSPLLSSVKESAQKAEPLATPPVRPPSASRSDASPSRKRARDVFDAGDFDFPAKLSSRACRERLDEFIAFRREKRKPLTRSSIPKLLEQWAAKGPERFIAAVDHTIAQGWQGLREPDPDDRTRGSPQTSSPPDDDRWKFTGDEG